jgi:hypothetical protein
MHLIAMMTAAFVAATGMASLASPGVVAEEAAMISAPADAGTALQQGNQQRDRGPHPRREQTRQQQEHRREQARQQQEHRREQTRQQQEHRREQARPQREHRREQARQQQEHRREQARPPGHQQRERARPEHHPETAGPPDRHRREAVSPGREAHDARPEPRGRIERIGAALRRATGREAGPRRGGGAPSMAELQALARELPPRVRRLAASPRMSDRIVVTAVTRGHHWGMDPHAVDVRVDRDRVVVLNRAGHELLVMPEHRARELGSWTMLTLGNRRPTGNAPAFCRSGEGHPVWGREWCLMQGFGLGSPRDMIWSRARVDDVVFVRVVDSPRLTRPTLVEVLGDVVFNRLAVHALSLGFTEPLQGIWVVEPAPAPRILRIQAGDFVLAELVDLDRSNRVDVLYVIQPL